MAWREGDKLFCPLCFALIQHPDPALKMRRFTEHVCKDHPDETRTPYEILKQSRVRI